MRKTEVLPKTIVFGRTKNVAFIICLVHLTKLRNKNHNTDMLIMMLSFIAQHND